VFAFENAGCGAACTNPESGAMASSVPRASPAMRDALFIGLSGSIIVIFLNQILLGNLYQWYVVLGEDLVDLIFILGEQPLDRLHPFVFAVAHSH
jgi:hypothetical protein